MSAFRTIQEFSKMLKNLDAWIAKAEEHAKAKSFDANVLVGSRLAPDMYSFDKQVQSACDSAKFAAAYFTGKEAPAHPDTEKTIDELKKRIATCTAYLATFKEADFAGWQDKKISPRWLEGKWVRGEDYLYETSIPNFFFHLTTAYAILRHNGVAVGKMDYIGKMSVQG
jgi:hypothetical protein